ncbi:hypothetical protein Bbelb_099400 [Branchiostoma belcheri]|nr:hypothetical protein Bbelb_099400 [Branchiostoma belcheri]
MASSAYTAVAECACHVSALSATSELAEGVGRVPEIFDNEGTRSVACQDSNPGRCRCAKQPHCLTPVGSMVVLLTRHLATPELGEGGREPNARQVVQRQVSRLAIQVNKV